MSNFAFPQAVGRPETWTPSNCNVGDASGKQCQHAASGSIGNSPEMRAS